jgi:hypothetical protein
MRKALWCFFPAFAAVFAQDPSSGKAVAAKVCSIPLLNVLPPGTSDTMPAIRPQARVLAGGSVKIPAPACDSAVFANK